MLRAVVLLMFWISFVSASICSSLSRSTGSGSKGACLSGSWWWGGRLATRSANASQVTHDRPRHPPHRLGLVHPPRWFDLLRTLEGVQMTLTLDDIQTKRMIERLTKAREALVMADVHGDISRGYLACKAFGSEGDSAYHSAQETSGKVYSALQFVDAVLSQVTEKAQ